MKKDILIIGAGPAGLYTALNTRGVDVVIIEEHIQPGIPKHCAGIVGEYVAQLVNNISNRIIDASYRKIVFITPMGKTRMEFKKPIAYHVNRPLLEQVLASRVESLGHTIIWGQKAKPRGLNTISIGDRDVEYNKLVVAEGPLGIFKKKLIREKGEYLYGFQVLCEADIGEEDAITILYSEYTPEFFTWVTPVSNGLVQIGYASRKPREEILLKHVEKYTGVVVKRVLERYGGLIPISKPLKNPLIHGKIVFHGDAVPLVKPYTGGGLYYIFKLSPLLAKHLEEDTLNKYIKDYKTRFYIGSRIEYLATNFSRKTRYFIPVSFVNTLYKMGLVEHVDFDKHYRLILKLLGVIPLLPFSFLYLNTR